MVLSNEERSKFSKYLDESIVSDSMLINQMKAMDLPDAMYKMMDARIRAFTLVRDYLDSVEEQVIK